MNMAQVKYKMNTENLFKLGYRFVVRIYAGILQGFVSSIDNPQTVFWTPATKVSSFAFLIFWIKME